MSMMSGHYSPSLAQPQALWDFKQVALFKRQTQFFMEWNRACRCACVMGQKRITRKCFYVPMRNRCKPDRTF